MEQKYKGMKKNCFWRHGPYKTIKIIEHTYDGKFKMPNAPASVSLRGGSMSQSARNNYSVKRILVVQQCMTCGKVIMGNSTDHDTSNSRT